MEISILSEFAYDKRFWQSESAPTKPNGKCADVQSEFAPMDVLRLWGILSNEPTFTERKFPTFFPHINIRIIVNYTELKFNKDGLKSFERWCAHKLIFTYFIQYMWCQVWIIESKIHNKRFVMWARVHREIDTIISRSEIILWEYA